MLVFIGNFQYMINDPETDLAMTLSLTLEFIKRYSDAEAVN